MLIVKCFFSPSGWDNMKKISIIFENLQSMKPDDYYRNIIAPPVTTRKVSMVEYVVQLSFLLSCTI